MYLNNETKKRVASHQYNGEQNPFDLPVWTAPLFSEGVLTIDNGAVLADGVPIEKGNWIVFDFDKVQIFTNYDFSTKYTRLHP